MRSKAEILDIIYHCINRGQCPDCPLFSDEDCTIHIFSALNTLLNKSDFEVMNEILPRSNGLSFYVPYLPDELGIKTLGLAFQDGPVFRIAFDAEGNIL